MQWWIQVGPHLIFDWSWGSECAVSAVWDCDNELCAIWYTTVTLDRWSVSVKERECVRGGFFATTREYTAKIVYAHARTLLCTIADIRACAPVGVCMYGGCKKTADKMSITASPATAVLLVRDGSDLQQWQGSKAAQLDYTSASLPLSLSAFLLLFNHNSPPFSTRCSMSPV